MPVTEVLTADREYLRQTLGRTCRCCGVRYARYRPTPAIGQDGRCTRCEMLAHMIEKLVQSDVAKRIPFRVLAVGVGVWAFVIAGILAVVRVPSVRYRVIWSLLAAGVLIGHFVARHATAGWLLDLVTIVAAACAALSFALMARRIGLFACFRARS